MLEKYKLLMNSTYLYLLQYHHAKINYSALGEAMGISRKTVSKEYSEFCNIEGWDRLFDIKDFHNDEKNKNVRAVLILQDLRPDITSIDEIAKILDISTKTLYSVGFTANDYTRPIGCIYKISYKDEIIYIGSTANFEKRKQQHLNAIKNKHIDKAFLYKYCVNNNISADDIVIEPILEDAQLANRFNVETAIINLLKPIGNNT